MLIRTGDCNTALGQSSLDANTTGTRNIAVGGEALEIKHYSII
jgi:hypothetical protein